MGQTVYATARDRDHDDFGIAFGLFSDPIVVCPAVVIALAGELALGQVSASRE
jgi:hypothetical protein